MRQGTRHALALFHEAAIRVPAYKDFLKKHGVRHAAIRSVNDFAHVPPTTKENYIDAYKGWKTAWDGDSRGMHMISTSSGTTAMPHYWPRAQSHDVDGAIAHELFLEHIFRISKRPTLFINGFAMGNWIAGTFTMSAVSLVAWKGYPITLMTPGYDREAILTILRDIAPRFPQTIIAGHAPFLKELAEIISDRGLQKSTRIAFLGTGQGITESWRRYVAGMVNGTDLLRTVINLYGSADASLMGFESPVSIALRQGVERNGTAKELFGDDRLPSLYHFDPRLTFMESQGDELVITKDSGIPLIRYNIHDRGGVYGFRDLVGHVADDAVKRELKRWTLPLPFVYLFGREKFMAKVYGANVYTEHVQAALDHPSLQRRISGKFLLETSYDVRENPMLVVRVELSPLEKPSRTLTRAIQTIFIEEVGRVNSEYRFILGSVGRRAHPTIKLYPHGHATYFPKGVVKKTG
jgi:phenylacetate-CoA ligase